MPKVEIYSDVEKLGIRLIQCTATLIDQLTSESLQAVIENTKKLDSGSILKLTCVYYSILDAAAQCAFLNNTEKREYSDDEYQSVMYALVFMLKEKAHLPDDRAKKATWDVSLHMRSPEYKQLSREWGQKALNRITAGQQLILFKLRALYHEKSSGDKINIMRYLDPTEGLMADMAQEKEALRRTIQSTRPKSGCFIATACYGDVNAPEVVILRKYRDTYMFRTRAGSAFVEIYYFISPYIARILSRHRWLSLKVRKCVLDPIVRRIQRGTR